MSVDLQQLDGTVKSMIEPIIMLPMGSGQVWVGFAHTVQVCKSCFSSDSKLDTSYIALLQTHRVDSMTRQCILMEDREELNANMRISWLRVGEVCSCITHPHSSYTDRQGHARMSGYHGYVPGLMNKLASIKNESNGGGGQQFFLRMQNNYFLLPYMK